MATMETSEVLKMMQVVSKRPNNTLTLKLNVLVLTFREWLSGDKKKMYTYTSFSEQFDGLVQFNSARLLPKGKVSEVLLTMTGFKAYEALRP